jgi:hypothetical protein
MRDESTPNLKRAMLMLFVAVGTAVVVGEAIHLVLHGTL